MLRFLWLASRGYRLRPWRSPFLAWRIETFSGLEAERVSLGVFLAFAWRERAALLRFLRWSAEMGAYSRRGRRALQSGAAGPSET
ncbi:MAG: hypothetical protein ACRD1L_01530 [Terriglobales bacterium]